MSHGKVSRTGRSRHSAHRSRRRYLGGGRRYNRIVLEGLRRREESIAALCRFAKGLNHESLLPGWSKEFLEAGKKRLLGDTTREAYVDGGRRRVDNDVDRS